VSHRELVVLGTASQVPTRYRNHNGYLLLWDGRGLLFDPGEGTQRQMLHAGVSATQITRVLVTHFHGDHCLGLAGLVQRISLDEVPHEVAIHYPGSGQVYFDRLRRASIFVDRSKIAPRPIAASGEIHRDKTLSIEAVALDHGVETFGYRVVEPDGWRMDPARLRQAGVRGPAVGELLANGSVRVGSTEVHLADVAAVRPGQKVAFVMDTRLCDGAFALARGVDMLVCESTYLHSEAREAREHGHLTARQAATIAAESGARSLVLTHFSQRYPSTQPFLEEARAVFAGAVAVRDGDRVPVPRR
jgi:ribonuclease Z